MLQIQVEFIKKTGPFMEQKKIFVLYYKSSINFLILSTEKLCNIHYIINISDAKVLQSKYNKLTHLMI